MSDIEFKAEGYSQIKSGNVKAKKKAIKINSSTFLVLINPNIRVAEDSPEMLEIDEKLHEATSELLENINNFKDLVVFRNSDAWSNKTIKSVNNAFSVEYGQKNKTVHVHFISEIKHMSNIHLNREKILEAYAHALDIPADQIKINIKVAYNEKRDAENMLNYVLKHSKV